ncbi:MAG: hypothetical protein JWQ26_1070, partial [Modestobacter sp.]|nr:hypothetical protein [Modestobacter sp.]
MRLAQVAAGVLVGVAVLAGCSSKEPANDTLPTPSATSAEASETLPPLGPADFPMPAEAREKTPAGAEAFLRYYIDIYNRAQQQLDAGPLRDLSQNCETCNALATDIENDKLANYAYEGGAVSIDTLSTPSLKKSSA